MVPVATVATMLALLAMLPTGGGALAQTETPPSQPAAPVTPSAPAPPAPHAADSSTTADVVAIPPPVTVMVGRVMMKDGVTPVAGAEVRMTGAVDGEPRVAQSNRAGRFKLRLPAGGYRMQITRRMEIYKAAAVFRVPSGGRLDIDLLLLPDFEKSPGTPAGVPTGAPAAAHAPAQSSARAPEQTEAPKVSSGPDPQPTSPSVVGSIVDMIHPHSNRRWSRWAEVLGFIGSLLAVAIVAD